MHYFDLGSMTFRDENNRELATSNPYELALGMTYSRQLSKHLGVGLTIKYIRSDLVGGADLSASNSGFRPGNTAAADVAVYYNTDINNFYQQIGLMGGDLSLGANLSNLGAKITYTTPDNADFIPSNFKAGAGTGMIFDEFNSLNLNLDFNKLMVPTPPIRNDQNQVIAGRNSDDIGFISGIFGSFADAPDGFNEELAEFIVNFGAEYWYAETFAVRGGYFHESKRKGNRKYATLGFGINYQKYKFDFAYLLPFTRNHPLENTLRFTLSLDITKSNAEKSESVTEE